MEQYSWTSNGAGTLTNATTLTPTYNAVKGDEGNAVKLTMTVTSNNSCSGKTATATYTVNVDPLPTATVTEPQIKTICSNSSYTLTGGEASSANGNISWTEDGAGSITSGVILLLQLIPLQREMKGKRLPLQ